MRGSIQLGKVGWSRNHQKACVRGLPKRKVVSGRREREPGTENGLASSVRSMSQLTVRRAVKWNRLHLIPSNARSRNTPASTVE